MFKNDILKRSLTGTVFIVSILGSIYLNTHITIAVFGLYLLMGLLEYNNFFKNEESISIPVNLFLFVGLSIYFILSESFNELIPVASVFLIFPLLFVYFIIEIWRKKENPLFNLGTAIFGFVYLVLPFVLLILLTQQTTILSPVLTGMFLLIWANDSFAYLSGRFFGKHKLLERISPKKTWEGVIGGFVFTILFSLLTAHYLDASQDYVFWVVTAIIVVPCAILGDLLESLFKRSLDIKDSGTILPGHGGILDRFDATLVTVPFFFSWYMLYNW